MVSRLYQASLNLILSPVSTSPAPFVGEFKNTKNKAGQSVALLALRFLNDTSILGAIPDVRNCRGELQSLLLKMFSTTNISELVEYKLESPRSDTIDGISITSFVFVLVLKLPRIIPMRFLGEPISDTKTAFKSAAKQALRYLESLRKEKQR